MTDRMIPVPESALRALAARRHPRSGPPSYISLEEIGAIDTLVACLPEPSPALTDSDCSTCGLSNAACLEVIDKGGRSCCLTCYRTDTHNQRTPPPSPALVELVEAARGLVCNVHACGTFHDRLRAAVAAYDEQEGTA